MVKVGEYDEEFLLERAAKIVLDKTKDSTIFCEESEALIPTFASSEITIGTILGRGGFCTVSEISKVKLADGGKSAAVHHHDDEDEEEQLGFAGGQAIIQDRAFIAQRCLRKGKDARYAIKKLSKEVQSDPNRFVAGVIDLAIESRFLAVVKHPNIIKMRATSDSNPYKHGYFVVLDRLYDTLTKRFGVWKKAKGKATGLGKLSDMKGKKKEELWIERLLVAYDLAAALRYLHSLNIVYRDLKPDNIGFDVRGDVKLFDFGLAKEIRPEEKLDDDLYKMSGNTGSLRYMAPEVALEKPYNSSVDVYSFGILFWQITSLETPFTGFSLNMHNDRVIRGGLRPALNPKIGPGLNNLMKNCWSTEIHERPTFQEVAEVLRNEVSVLRGDSECILDASNRTAKSL
eukprot:CAMPEP_0185828626 /NCGR_PEP_ID=MMETSP1322-20130828/32649_1 /TAXON_ID=265543 /ORGANISM="Minutocellus polymorphus, Strain RCC2270" /LENGTH=400 /DNA_ID=CAMNT_0028526367 /DNA_START=50 /DNA_END=1252 /DNA_ORIENTATION=-